MLSGYQNNRQPPFGRLLGGLWQGLEDDFADMERRMDQLLRDAAGGHANPPLVWGYTMQVGPEGNTHVQPFGNVAQSNEALAEGWREPFTTSVVDEENNVVRVTAELPGAKKSDIEVETLGDRVRISAAGEQWKYRTEVALAVEVKADGADASFNNGILEVTLPLAKPANPPGKKLNIR